MKNHIICHNHTEELSYFLNSTKTHPEARIPPSPVTPTPTDTDTICPPPLKVVFQVLLYDTMALFRRALSLDTVGFAIQVDRDQLLLGHLYALRDLARMD